MRVALVALFLPGLAAAGEPDPLAAVEARQQEIFARVGPSVVFLSAGDSLGSGFFVSSDGLILTCAHVVGGNTAVEVVRADGRKYAGRVVERGSGEVDLALVQIEARDTQPLPLVHAAALRVGSWVAAVGHGRGGIWSFNTGMVSNIYPEGTDRPVFQTQIPLNPGNSGGPIVDRTGAVVGVVTAGIQGSNSINFAIRSEVALRALPLLARYAPCLEVLAPPGVAVFVDGKMVGTGPRVVVPAEPRRYQVFAVVNGTMKKQDVSWPAHRTADLR